MVWGLVVWESLLQRGFGYLVLSGSSGMGVGHQEQVERGSSGFPKTEPGTHQGLRSGPPLVLFFFPPHV